MADPTGKTVLGMSKTTVSGILTGAIGTCSAIMSYQVPVALMNPNQQHTWLYVTAGANLLSIVLKVWLGVIQQDAAK